MLHNRKILPLRLFSSLVLVAVTSSASAQFFEKFHPDFDPIYTDLEKMWLPNPPGVHMPVYAYVSLQEYFSHDFYTGNTQQLNAFLERCVEHVQLRRNEMNADAKITQKLVIHPGRFRPERPFTSKQPVPEPQWELRKSHEGREWEGVIALEVHVWLGSEIDLSALHVPRPFSVELSGEIERFVNEQNSRHAK